ncbi:unnamed protein product, partial [Scytosiphon promiscuus]
ETPSLCCQNGKVRLWPLPASPDSVLLDLVRGDTAQSKSFLKNIRRVNSAFSFTSTGAGCGRTLNQQRFAGGPPTFVIQGAFHHYLSSPLPPERHEGSGNTPHQPRYAEVYFYSAEDEQLSYRLNNFEELNTSLLREGVAAVQGLLSRVNPYVGIYRSAIDMYRSSQAAARAEGRDPEAENLRVFLRTSNTPDRRRYNASSAPMEVAAILPDSNEDARGGRDIVVHDCRRGLTRVFATHPSYDPLAYPILNPTGVSGWHGNIDLGPQPGSGITAPLCPRPDSGAQGGEEDRDEGDDQSAARGGGSRGGARKKVSQREFFAYRAADRHRQRGSAISDPNLQLISMYHRGGRLFQQYMVDTAAQVEDSKLSYQRHHQSELRAALYSGLADALRVGDNAGDFGRRVVLASTFVGGPRYMVQQYQDAMAIVRKYGKPDLFVTFTCNPAWPEIKDALLEGQTPTDRPDIVSRVFHAKLRALENDLYKNGCFGTTVAWCRVVEFQKRGLPHAHILIIVDGDEKPQPEDYDQYVSAELPNPDSQPRLFHRVVSSMVHGPCGSNCQRDGVCSKSYPRDFQDETISSEDGYAVYRRRRSAEPCERTVTLELGVFLRGRWVDNRWVVPYCPSLTLKYDAHINVEICSSVRAVKYLYKYVFKGNDRALAAIAQPEGAADEITNFVEARYLGSCEAAWSIFAFPITERFPSVLHLALHEPGGQTVYYGEGQAAARLHSAGKTTLTEFFAYNAAASAATEDDDADSDADVALSLLYQDFPTHFTWNKATKKWKPRQRQAAQPQVGRIYSAHPGHGERFYLRLLLCHIPGPVSFRALRTLPDGNVAETFQEACRLRGLLADDLEWDRCLTEAAGHQTCIAALRELFVTILRHCDVGDPLSLWQSHRNSLAEDFLHEARATDPSREMCDEFHNLALLHIDRCLRAVGSGVVAYRLPSPVEPAPRDLPYEIIEELAGHNHDELRRLQDESIGQFNTEQRAAFDCIMAAQAALLDEDGGRRRVLPADQAGRGFFFVDGPGGTGKTFLYSAVLAAIRSRGKIALAVASSGVASTLLPRARTAHSLFMIPINIRANSSCYVEKQSSRAQLLRMADAIFWDEAPMTHRHGHEAVERCLRDVMGNDLPWGGKIVVMGGDFRQILPVVRRGSRAQVVSACVNQSALWRGVRLLQLRINMRVLRAGMDDPHLREFCAWQMRIGNGTEEDARGSAVAPFTERLVRIPDDLIVAGEDPCHLINAVFPNLDAFGPNGDHEARLAFTRRSVLAPRNDDQRSLNEDIMRRVPVEEFESLSVDGTADMDSSVIYPGEFLETLTPSGMPTHRLVLKVGAPFMLLRTINPSTGLFNGTRCLLIAASQSVLHAEIATGPNARQRAFVPRCKLTSSEGELPFVLTRRQFPVAPCFAMTVNKAQGQTLDRVGIFLRRPVFSHGQLYVAVSRATSRQNLRFMVIGGSSTLPDGSQGTCTANPVYEEVL